MKRIYVLIPALVAAALMAAWAGRGAASAAQMAPAQSDAEKAKAAELLATLEPYIGGEWICTGKWSDGRPLNAREVYEWGIGGKFVKVKTYLTGAAGERQRYEAMYGVKDGKLMSWSFTEDGSVQTAEWTVDGRKWSTTSVLPNGSTLHQSVELVEPDKFRWLLETEKDGQRSPMFDGLWERRSSVGQAMAPRG